MFNKDILHPKMRRMIENPRILLIDSGLEYTKGESQTNIEMQSTADFEFVISFICEICSYCCVLLSFATIQELFEKGGRVCERSV